MLDAVSVVKRMFRQCLSSVEAYTDNRDIGAACIVASNQFIAARLVMAEAT